jgi:hypothetical protein
MARKNTILTAMVIAVAGAACDTTDTTDPLGGPENAVVMPAEQATNPVDVARAVPSFGGMYIDDYGRPTVYLADLSDASRARRVLSAFARDNGRDEDDIQFLQANFRLGQLNHWYDETWPKVMEQAGTVFSDVDESSNKMLFGVERPGLATAVNAIMRAHGVPAEAYEVRVVEPIANAATLRDVVNPKVGGLQIHFSSYLCTLGFNVTANNRASFITNSHCTATQGGVENTLYYQPTSTASSTVIAQEVADPGYVKGQPAGCPRNKRCRYSDSSRAEYRSGISFDLGGIAATSGSNLTITGTHNITAEADANRTPVAVGATVSKTGRTTGTSTGQVTNTCVNTSVQGSNIMQLCQTFVAAAVGSGDSGSPVYSGSGNVTLVGILWGGGTNTFAFSPLRSIKDELGNFTAH